MTKNVEVPIREDELTDSCVGDIMNRNASLQRGADFCLNCGNRLTEDALKMRECQECGKRI
jgi:membrane protease subunit (stomatin/prohibitin family)